mmetsp:Transcript_64105/g.171581  ORF Transcript_64105/g.171581 Transcript_64105/m.171581 type:complete len:212 (+) Transcript_64105:1685-2320(+)
MGSKRLQSKNYIPGKASDSESEPSSIAGLVGEDTAPAVQRSVPPVWPAVGDTTAVKSCNAWSRPDRAGVNITGLPGGGDPANSPCLRPMLLVFSRRLSRLFLLVPIPVSGLLSITTCPRACASVAGIRSSKAATAPSIPDGAKISPDLVAAGSAGSEASPWPVRLSNSLRSSSASDGLALCIVGTRGGPAPSCTLFGSPAGAGGYREGGAK